MKNSLRAILFFCSSFSLLHSQTPAGYLLIKTGSANSAFDPSVLNEQFIASNNTSTNSTFYILLTPRAGRQIHSVTLAGGSALPLQNSKPGLYGPLYLAANASVTLGVVSSSTAGTAPGSGTSGSAIGGFALVPDSQSGLASVLSSAAGFSGRGLIHSAVAAPNVSRNHQAVHFLVVLNASAQIQLTLLTLAGERIYGAQVQGNAGTNSLPWNIQNDAGQAVASGLYFYDLRAVGNDGSVETRTGKLLVIH